MLVLAEDMTQAMVINMSMKLLIFSYQSVLTYAFGAQKNQLIEMVLLSTQNICFD